MSKFRVGGPSTKNVQEVKYPLGIDLLADIQIDQLHEAKEFRKMVHYFLDSYVKELHSLTELLKRRL